MRREKAVHVLNLFVFVLTIKQQDMKSKEEIETNPYFNPDSYLPRGIYEIRLPHKIQVF